MPIHQNQKVLRKAVDFTAFWQVLCHDDTRQAIEPHDRTASGTLGLSEVVMCSFPDFCTPSNGNKAPGSQSFLKAWLPLLVQGA